MAVSTAAGTLPIAATIDAARSSPNGGSGRSRSKYGPSAWWTWNTGSRRQLCSTSSSHVTRLSTDPISR